MVTDSLAQVRDGADHATGGRGAQRQSEADGGADASRTAADYSFIDLPNVSCVVLRLSFCPAVNELLRKHRTDCSLLSGEYPSVRPRHTAIAVAQIFSITSRKFPQLTDSGPHPPQNAPRV